MKKVNILLILFSAFHLLVNGGCAQENKNSTLPFTSAIVTYSYQGTTTGEEIMYVDLKANKIAVEASKATTLGGITNAGDTLMLYDGKVSYAVDLNKKTAIKLTKEGSVVSEIFGEQRYRNYYIRQESFLGKTCKVYKAPRGTFYFWQGIPLKQETSMQLKGQKVNFTKEAIDINLDAHIPRNKFQLPAGIKVTSIEKMMQEMKRRLRP